MFYLASKLFWVAVQPGNLGLFCLTFGLALTVTRWQGAGQILIGLLLIAGFIFLFFPVDDWLLAPLEDRFPRPAAAPGCIDGIVVLGGGELRRVTRARNGPEMSERLMRLVDAAALLRQHPEATLYFAGGGVDAHILPPTEADIARAILKLMDVDMSRVRFEDQSRDTWENFVNLKAIAKPHPGQQWVLVTSALHMPRAIGIGRRLGWEMLAWPTDYVSVPNARSAEQFNFSSRLAGVQDALHEWIGLAAYRLAGKMDTFFPAPEATAAGRECPSSSPQ